MSNYQEYKKHNDSIKKLVETYSTDLVREMFEIFFKKFPECNMIQLTAYTPTWNDGEECTQSIDIEYSSDILSEFDEDTVLEIATVLGYDEENAEEDPHTFIDDANANPDDLYLKHEDIENTIDMKLIDDVLGDNIALFAFVDQNGVVHVYDEGYDGGY